MTSQEKDLTQFAWTFFPKRGDAQPKIVYPGRNFDKDTLTYTTPPKYADTIRDTIVAQYRGHKFAIIDSCGCIGGTTLSFLESKDIYFVISYEISPEIAKMLKRNINSYGFGQKSIVRNTSFNGIDLRPFAGCAVFFDPPWLPSDVKGSLSSKSQYLLSGIKLGDYTLEQYLAAYRGVVYSMTFHLPPGYQLGTSEGWEIKKVDRMGGPGMKVVKGTIFYCVCPESSVYVVPNYGGYKGIREMENAVNDLTANWVDPDPPLTTGGIYTKEVVSSPGKGALLPKPVKVAQQQSIIPKIIIPSSIAPVLPTPRGLDGNPLPVRKKTKPKASAPSIQQTGGTVPGVNASGSWKEFTDNLTSVNAQSDKKNWVLGLQRYMYIFLRGFIDDKDVVMQMVNKKNMEVWKDVFTHETFDSNRNYETYEILGDGVLKAIFRILLIKRDSTSTASQISSYETYYMAKMFQSSVSVSLGFPYWLKTAGRVKLVGVNEDLFESVFGGLHAIGERIKPGYGFVICQDLLDLIFRDIPFDVAYSLGHPKTLITQTAKRLGLTTATDKKDTGVIDETTESRGKYTTILTFTDRVKEYLRQIGISKSLTGRGVGSTKTSSSATAYYDMYANMNSAGFTQEVVARLKDEMDLALQDPELVAKAKAKSLLENKTDHLSFNIPKSTHGENSVVIQLVAVPSFGQKIILATAQSTTDNSDTGKNVLRNQTLLMYTT